MHNGLLSSDLVSSFKRHATAWGDNMTAVLSNAINAFLESSKDGTLIELKRFLLEDTFRNNFLESVEDPSIHYYWKHEYYMVKKGIDFKECIENKKIVLIKLSQGLIGEDNSYLYHLNFEFEILFCIFTNAKKNRNNYKRRFSYITKALSV